jgi:hypothetical protein
LGIPCRQYLYIQTAAKSLNKTKSNARRRSSWPLLALLPPMEETPLLPQPSKLGNGIKTLPTIQLLYGRSNAYSIPFYSSDYPQTPPIAKNPQKIESTVHRRGYLLSLRDDAL